MSTAAKKKKAARKKQKEKKPAFFGIMVLVLLCGAAIGAVSVFLSNHAAKETYSLLYRDLIVSESAAFDVDPYLVAAVIHCESSGRRDAVSPKGAVGLMQIMPDTGEWIAEKLQMDTFSEAMLTEPEINIRMGCWYLSYLSRRYEGNKNSMLAAYNAGPGNVSKWLEDPIFAENGNLTDIPFEETAAYVKKVLAVEEIYRELYEEELG